MQEATFQPHINQHSLEIMQERRGSSGAASFLNRLEADLHGRKMRLQVPPHATCCPAFLQPVLLEATNALHSVNQSPTPILQVQDLERDRLVDSLWLSTGGNGLLLLVHLQE